MDDPTMASTFDRDASASVQSAEGMPGSSATLPLRVLLVEDDEDDYLLTRALLSDVYGTRFQLDWIQTYEAARLLLNNPTDEALHDVYLIDYRLGEHNGLELLADAQAQGLRVPIIVLTGADDRRIDLQAMAAGASEYLVKTQLSGPLLERTIRYTLSKRQHLEALKATEHQRQMFVAMLTHDLKTPLRASLRVLDLLKSEHYGAVTSGQQLVLEELIRANRHLYRMIENLLTTYKLEAEPMVVKKEHVILEHWLPEVLNPDLYRWAEEKSQQLTVTVEPGLSTLWFDPMAFQRVITNLLENAICYTQTEGCVQLWVESEPGGWCFSVVDNGPGMTPQELLQLFKPFASFSKKYRHVGTGLGLYVAQQIVQAHQGRLQVESEPGQGTRFLIHLPSSAV
ncbi:MAG: HAMP domain-containing sensor histidine kinase [Candidatus Melainabacteria bacterium]|nr:HAMP domain-containing sensor histidine kinase [Candidatus Melainabacteria bacterium]